jgi:hypothetical protein
MTNPFKKHSSNLFADRGSDIDQAMAYCMSLVDTLQGSDKAAAMTAIMVLVNTASSAFDAVPPAAPAGPSPERLALIDLIRGEIESWASEELEGKMTDWAQSELDLDAAVENWADSNMEDKIRETINDMEATVSFR